MAIEANDALGAAHDKLQERLEAWAAVIKSHIASGLTVPYEETAKNNEATLSEDNTVAQLKAALEEASANQ